jgi:hypothetical protein
MAKREVQPRQPGVVARAKKLEPFRGFGIMIG